MKLDNKGFAISGVLYALLLLFITLFIGILTVLASTKFSLDKVKGDIESKLQLNTNISSDNNCIRDVESKCPEGTRVNVKVNASENYSFYVINDNGKQLTLIMDRNIGDKVEWGTSQSLGPITAIEALESRTNGWTNIPKMNYTYADDGGGSSYKLTERENIRARLLTYTEATNLGCTTTNNTCHTYLYTNLSESNTIEEPFGYWTTGAQISLTTSTWTITYGGSVIGNTLSETSSFGVRPVITISKTL